jgi:hypothetical protein
MTLESWGSGGRSWERGENIPSLQESLDQSPAVSLDRSGGEHGYQAQPWKGAPFRSRYQAYRTHLRSQEVAASRLIISLTKQRLILVVA